ncbi:hypothetical protein [Rubrobacter calidifluminis]|uniref:hypothetical protein n=1 Tax=Rubrobacter calidifluminis TaxID=1392640 RepID=UPI0023614C47|nr:hypothetical protein [Rubrobacter calidifluminis]
MREVFAVDLEALYGGSFVNWEAVGESWQKRTLPSRMLLIRARAYLERSGRPELPERVEIISRASLPEEIRRAFASPPEPEDEDTSSAWGDFIDAALVAELEVVSYGERPPILQELRAGLEKAAEEAGERTPLGRWFLARRDALPGRDLPDDTGYLPV